MPAPKSSGSSRKRTRTESPAATPVSASERASFAEQLVNRIVNPLGLVLLTRERIQDALDDAAIRGRITRSDANELVAELVKRGRQQTDDLLADVEQLLGRGRDQLESATRRARRTVSSSGSLPIAGYDELTAGQVATQLKGLTPVELRALREYERSHANRKSVLSAIDKALP